MAKPININCRKQIPTLKIKELERVYKKLGFVEDEQKHRHLIFRDKNGKQLILMKGQKDIPSGTLNQIITEMAKETGKTKKEIIEFIMRNK